MRNFCIIANNEKENSEKYAYEIQSYLIEKGCVCDTISAGPSMSYREDIKPGTECLIVLGGDGTVIHAAKEAAKEQIPIYGINCGGVGFLTDSDRGISWSSIDRLINDDFVIERRMMLAGKVEGEEKDADATIYTLNDFSISRREYRGLIQFEVHINGELLDTFRADGVVVSTPTGSTAYNLSAGGPVISPEVEAIVVTPICPHSINDRSFVIGGNDVIDIKLLDGKHADVDSAIVFADGDMVSVVKSGDMLHIEKAVVDTNIITMKKTNFYHKMRIKLITGGK